MYKCFRIKLLLINWIMERRQSSGFRHIFTVFFLLFLAPARGSNPSGKSITFPYLKTTYQKLK